MDILAILVAIVGTAAIVGVALWGLNAGKEAVEIGDATVPIPPGWRLDFAHSSPIFDDKYGVVGVEYVVRLSRFVPTDNPKQEHADGHHERP